MCSCMPKTTSDAVTDVQFNTSRSHLNMHECSGQELFGYKELQPVPQGKGAVFLSILSAQARSVACNWVALVVFA
jgi:tryptophanase